MQRIGRRLVAGDDWRRSRLHDMRGNFVGMQAMGRDVPRAFMQAALRRTLKRYPALPWIPYPAIRALDRLVRPNWSVLEHGAGMSTVWWAQRVDRVRSIEANRAWYERVVGELQKRSLANVEIEHRTDEHYSDLSMLEDAAFDIIVIDGHARDRVAAQVPRLLKIRGFVYFDNSDFAAQWHDMYGEAEDILTSWATNIGAELTYFTGMPPATTTATQGLLIAVDSTAQRRPEQRLQPAGVARDSRFPNAD